LDYEIIFDPEYEIFFTKEMSDTIVFEKRGSVGYIKLNRPKVFNSFNREMALALQSALDDCAEDENIRAIYLTGEGKAFCAGQDLAEVTSDDAPNLVNIVAEHYNPIVERIRNIELPIVCAVNGVAAGAGANIALACDVCVATESATFIQAFSKIGLIPDSGGTFTLPRLIGFQKASALMMFGDKIMAADAEKLGMLYKVFTDEAFESASYNLAEKLAIMPTKGLVYTKKLRNQSMTNDLTSQLKLEEVYQAKAADTYDYKEGVIAFLEKRKAEFIGR